MTKRIFLCVLLQISSALSVDPWSPGPYTPTHRHYFPQLNTGTGLDHQLDVWAPDGAGSFPIIYNIGGLGALLPGDVYDDLMLR